MKLRCGQCGKDFYISPSRLGKRKMCSVGCKAKSQIGKVAWNKGKSRWWKSFSFEKGIIPWNKGTKGLYSMSVEARKKMSISQKGELSHCWKGGITSFDKLERVKFRQKMQKLVFERDNYTCQICGSKNNLQVDHIQPWSRCIELRFCLNNCRTLCSKCHYLITFNKPMPEHIEMWGHNFKQI